MSILQLSKSASTKGYLSTLKKSHDGFVEDSDLYAFCTNLSYEVKERVDVYISVIPSLEFVGFEGKAYKDSGEEIEDTRSRIYILAYVSILNKIINEN